MTQAISGRGWRAVAISLVALALVACASDGQRFSTTLRYPDGSYPLPVVVVDQTGLVVSVDRVAAGAGTGDTVPVVTLASDKSGIAVSWLGGACTDGATISFGRTPTGFSIHLRGSHPMFGSCPAIGLFRSVFIRLSEPIDPSTIVVSGAE
jgi:hypothetical protein